MNWKPIIETVCEAFGDQKHVAGLLGIEPSAITRMKQGTLRRVSYETGCKIMDLHRQAQKQIRRNAARAS